MCPCVCVCVSQQKNIQEYRLAKIGLKSQSKARFLNFTDYSSPAQLVDIIVGKIYLQWIYFLLQIFGWVDGVVYFSDILYDCFTKRNLCPSMTLKTYKTVNNVDTIKGSIQNELCQAKYLTGVTPVKLMKEMRNEMKV